MTANLKRGGNNASAEAVPAYLRIASALRERIGSGVLSPGDPLPPERDLSVEFGVSRMTARQAVIVLEHEGLVHRSGTRGTFVSHPKLELRLGSFSQEVLRAGHFPSAELFWADQRPAGEHVGARLGLDPADQVIALQRLRRVDSEPIAVETTYYPAARLPRFLAGDLTGSLWDRLRVEYGIQPARSVASLEMVSLDTAASRSLAVREGAGGIQLTRSTFDRPGSAIEFAVDIYRSDRVALILERSVDDDQGADSSPS